MVACALAMCLVAEPLCRTLSAAWCKAIPFAVGLPLSAAVSIGHNSYRQFIGTSTAQRGS